MSKKKSPLKIAEAPKPKKGNGADEPKTTAQGPKLLVVATDGTSVNIVQQTVSNLELVTIGHMLVNEGQKRMTGAVPKQP